MLSLARIILPAVAVGLVLSASAQNTNTNGPTVPAGPAWNSLNQFENSVPGSPQASGTVQTIVAPGGGSASASSVVSDYLQRANAFQNFLTNYPGDTHSAEARRLEALMLVKAAIFGDTTQTARLAQLIATVRRDTSLPADKRFALAVLADNLAVSLVGGSSQDDRLKAYETIARGHVREFAGVPGTYESLLHVAQSSNDAAATRIANDLLTMSAPPAVQDGARSLLVRHALLGTSLASALAGAVNANGLAVLGQSQVVILYSWAASIPGSLAVAKLVSDHAPKKSALIGVNLDPDAASARVQAQNLSLQGLQLFAAPARSLADQLKLSGLPLVLGIDQNGVISSVSGTFAFATQTANSAK